MFWFFPPPARPVPAILMSIRESISITHHTTGAPPAPSPTSLTCPLRRSRPPCGWYVPPPAYYPLRPNKHIPRRRSLPHPINQPTTRSMHRRSPRETHSRPTTPPTRTRPGSTPRWRGWARGWPTPVPWCWTTRTSTRRGACVRVVVVMFGGYCNKAWRWSVAWLGLGLGGITMNTHPHIHTQRPPRRRRHRQRPRPPQARALRHRRAKCRHGHVPTDQGLGPLHGRAWESSVRLGLELGPGFVACVSPPVYTHANTHDDATQ